MIIDANTIGVLHQLETDVEIILPPSGAYIKGEYVPNSGTPDTKKLIVIPISGYELKNSESGEYTSEDRMVLEVGAKTLSEGTKFLFEGRKYEIRKEFDYVSVANIAKYIAKKI